MGKMKYLLSFIILFSTIAYTQKNENSSEFVVQLTVTERCEIQSTQSQSIDFGSIQRSTNNVSSSGSLNVSCSQNTPYSIALHSDKTLKNTQDSSIQVPYQLYQEAGFKTVWGSSSQENFASTGTGADQNFKIWAKINEGTTNIPAGVYIDTVIATITY
ncbi:Csu type fimbrial protein [Acinetobacter schindleri]|uniref:Csu type fimbrial protein n=1 Tax=Acinetobacter schindleri TaxID=108981 RepID=UPI002DB87942|nr:spore coat U domain-containing protein [Acinetobacter schindleri]MEB5930568.1 spore coat U domain-containing protein [Acinetobacter schindleri]